MKIDSPRGAGGWLPGHRSLLAAVASALLVAAVPSAASAAPGDLDPAFSSDGKVTTKIPGGNFELANAVTIQPSDGKIVVAGRTGGAGGRFALARYTTDGALDTSFGSSGVVVTNFTRGDDVPFGVAIQPSDGKIVAAGTASFRRFAAARYNADGSLDTTFGGDGTVTTNSTPDFDIGFDLVIQPSDGKIVVAGTAGGRLAAIRYSTDGSLDTTFSSDGQATVNLTGGFDAAFDLVLQPADQRIVAAGTAGGRNGRVFAIVRFNLDGTPDTAFDADGRVTSDFGPGVDHVDGVDVQASNGRIVVAGHTEVGTGRFALARYNSDGTLDTTFSTDGKLTTNFTRRTDGGLSVALQPSDGKIVAGGFAGGGGGRFAVARYNADGALDTTFSSDGKVTVNFTRSDDFVNDLVIQPSDGKIVAVGTAALKKFAMVRLLSA
jgi:uncharacterized delta-60 repeat protein